MADSITRRFLERRTVKLPQKLLERLKSLSSPLWHHRDLHNSFLAELGGL